LRRHTVQDLNLGLLNQAEEFNSLHINRLLDSLNNPSARLRHRFQTRDPTLRSYI
jgi:hypothetical protein